MQEYLKNIKLFGINDTQGVVDSIKKIKSEILNFEKDEYIAFRGDRVKGLYVNLSGTIVAQMLKENGEIKKVEDLEAGEILAAGFIFGDNNFFPVDVIAKTDCKILFIKRDEFLQLMMVNKTILNKFLNEVSNRMQFLSSNLWESISGLTIEKKLANYILKNAEDDKLILKESIKELSEYFNVSRPSLSRVFMKLVEEGIIERVKKGEYRILDMDELENL